MDMRGREGSNEGENDLTFGIALKKRKKWR